MGRQRGDRGAGRAGPSWSLGVRDVAASLTVAGVLALVGMATLEPPASFLVGSVRTGPLDTVPHEGRVFATWLLEHGWSSPDAGYRAVRRRLPADPERARRVILVALDVLRDTDHPRAQYTTRTNRFADDHEAPLGRYLRERTSPELTQALAVLVRDADAPMQLRQEAIVGLCGPGDAAHVDAVVALASDQSLEPVLREHLLHRIDRLDVPLRDGLRPLVDDPWEEVALTASVLLAVEGDFTAGSRVRASVLEKYSMLPLALELDALDAMVEASPEALRDVGRAVAAVRASMVAEDRFRGDGLERVERLREVVRATPAAAFVLRDSPFERRTRAYVSGPLWEREERSLDLDALPHLDPEEVDVAAGALAVEGSWREPRKFLRRVHFLAEWLRPQLDAVDAPRARMRVLHQVLRLRQGVQNGGWRESSLAQAVECRAGNCMANTLLVQALGDRLGLPLQPVLVPGHVLLEWDDGTVRFFYDPIGTGVDDDPDDHFGDAPRADRVPRRLDRREVLYFAAYNFALASGAREGSDEGIERLRAATRLVPHEARAWDSLLHAYGQQGRVEPGELRETVRVALDATTDPVATLGSAIDALLRNGLPHDAVELLDRPELAEASSPRWLPWARARCLALLGRLDEARAVLPALDSDLRANAGARSVELYIALRAEPRTARRRLETLYQEGVDAFDLHLELAKLCAASPPGKQPGPDVALDLLLPFWNEREIQFTDDPPEWKPGDGWLLGRQHVVRITANQLALRNRWQDVARARLDERTRSDRR